MLESVRLVIWDLDETFWQGTLSEGGITEFIQPHHEMVLELARRGIMSSICSKNDLSAVEAILREKGVWEYFIFPSIDWSPKGPRLAKIIERVQLRPPTVMFIDDNAGNRAEAEMMVPGLQVRGAVGITDLLVDPLFKGKDDRELTRLKQYKLLEDRQADAAQAGNNLEFLRSSQIRVMFDYDIEGNIDRVIELINRTNQLNFTKKRLPEGRDDAVAQIRKASKGFWQHLGLIRVVDRYGDYGHVGFFEHRDTRGGGSGTLEHFCFSCRTLGMGVEKWVYDKLGRPRIEIVGEVLTDLSSNEQICWITLQPHSKEQEWTVPSIPEVRLRGGCETDSLSAYLAIHSGNCWREATLVRGPFFVRKDVTAHLLIPPEMREDLEWVSLIRACGLEQSDFETAVFAPCQPGTVIIYSGLGDLYPKVRDKRTGRLFHAPGRRGVNAVEISQKEFDTITDREKYTDEEKAAAWRSMSAISSLCESKFPGAPFAFDQMEEDLTKLFSRFPGGSIGFALAADEFSGDERGKWYGPLAIRYNEILGRVAEAFNIEVFNFGHFVESEGERPGGGHFDRIVYFRVAQAMLASIERRLP